MQRSTRPPTNLPARTERAGLDGRLPRLLVAGLAVWLLASCSPGADILSISSSIPELQLLAELYQQEYPGTLVQLGGAPGTNWHTADSSGTDLMLDRELANPAFFRYLDDLSTAGETMNARLQLTYPFAPLADGKRLPLVMVAYDLPGLITRRENQPGDSAENLVTDMNELRRNSKDNAVRPESRVTSLYFSPLAAPDFCLLVCRSFGGRISSDRQGYPEWNRDFLWAGLDYLRTWCTESTGSPAAEQAFLDRYTYIPLPSLVASGRLKAAYMTASSFYSLPARLRSELGFRYLSLNGSIPVLDTAVYAGIPQKARNKDGARRFLTWLLNPETQKKYLARLHDSGLDSFGFLGGFSTLRTVTEKYLPLEQPGTQGMIVSDALLAPPDPVPLAWLRYRESVIFPFLKSAIGSDAGLDEADLKDRTARWYLQQGFDARF